MAKLKRAVAKMVQDYRDQYRSDRSRLDSFLPPIAPNLRSRAHTCYEPCSVK